MADVAPLNSAHAHARKAAHETDKVHWDEAAEEHRSAAADFSRAAKTAGDSEALRVLRLLEAQHEKIARIIKSHNTAQLNEAIAETTTTSDIEGAKDDAESSATTSTATGETSTPKKTSTTSAIAAARLNARARESSPSLARDIASRRGIRPQGNASSQATLTRSRQLSPESQRRKNAVAPRIPPSIMESSATLPAKKPHSKADDEGFATFYNSLTTGTMSKLSSVLAYAGLPLTAEEPQTRSEASQTPQAGVEKSRKDRSSNNRTVNATTEPDVKKYISKAALSAIEDDHRQRGSHGQVFGPAESFYVVQKGGGTYSYADIARNQQLHNAAAGRGGEDEESFVDAQEVVSPGSSGGGGGISSPRHSRAAFGKSRTAEELELENTTLKTTLEQLASRLSNFEVHAQDASMAAIAQSMASLHNSPHALPPGKSSAAATATTTAPATAAGDSAHTLQDALGRVRALEAQLTSQAEQHEKLEALAQKQERKIRMYHSKWEDVKKSAREKEKVKREKAEAEAAGKAGGSGG